MKQVEAVRHEFVEFIPDTLEDSTIYISFTYATAVHRCCCGCRTEVVTPLSPTDWALTFDGETVSLYPSIGNWSFACQSHYWIERNRVRWARRWTYGEIAEGRARDARAKEQRLSANTIDAGLSVDEDRPAPRIERDHPAPTSFTLRGLRARLRRWW